jgi:hypothetical protein
MKLYSVAEPRRDAAPTAPNLIIKNGINYKSSYFFRSVSYQFKSDEIMRENGPKPYVNFCLFKKVGLVYV